MNQPFIGLYRATPAHTPKEHLLVRHEQVECVGGHSVLYLLPIPLTIVWNTELERFPVQGKELTQHVRSIGAALIALLDNRFQTF